MKTLKVLSIIVLVIIVLPLLGYFAWLLKKGQALDVVVVNKTMTHFYNSENKAFNYILTSEKILTAGNRIYDLTKDHIGLFWNRGDYEIKYPRLKDVNRTAEKADLVYYADVTGIMTSQVKKLKPGSLDHLEYGGLNNTDYTLLRELISQEKMIVVECNFFGPPTESLVRYNLEKLTDVYYLGWIGRYVDDLASKVDQDELVNWKSVYEEYIGEAPMYSGPGAIFINMETRRIIVLEEGEHINTSMGFIVTKPEAMESFGLPEKTNYSGWFTMLHPGNNEVLSNFEMNATEKGRMLMNEAGISDSFPALIKVDEKFYFMAGDFGKSKSNIFFPKVLFIRLLHDGLKSKSMDSSNFFYSYYQPFMRTILDEVLTLKSEEE
jgi:hypothetical protein